MKLNIVTTKNQAKGNLETPKQFNEAVRPDLIKRAVLALQSAARQKYGANPEAGKRPSVRISKRRHDYRGTYGIGQSRTPRKAMSVRGTRFNWVGAFAPQTVGGRRAHAPKASKEWEKKINNKERLKAIRSAMAATLDAELVHWRGHVLPENYPFALDNSFEAIAKTKEAKEAFAAIGIQGDIDRASERKVRAGKGTMRGRKYKTKTSALFVVTDDCPFLVAADNIPGVDVVTVTELNTNMLAPGTNPGRMTFFTEGALEKISKEKLFLPAQRTKSVSLENGKKKSRAAMTAKDGVNKE